MGDRYVAQGQQDVTTATPGDTSLTIIASTLTRGWVYEWSITAGGTPADNAIQWLVRRFTAVGTEGAGVTPLKLDSAAPAAQLDAGENHSAEPTYSDVLWDQIVNQRAVVRWIAPFRGEYVIPATANNGIGWCAYHASYTGSAEATASWEE